MGQNENCLSQARVRIFVVFASYPTSECKMWNALVALVALVVASKWRSSLSQACSLRKGTEVAGAAFTHFPLLFFLDKSLKGFEC